MLHAFCAAAIAAAVTVTASAASGEATPLVERGRYLAVAGNCASCHTAAGGAFMAGGVLFRTPYGDLYSTNITPDADTGIGNWSESDFVNSMRHGVRPDGEHLYPAFPFTAFTRLRDEDMRAIYAYLLSLPPVSNTAPDNELSFPFNIRSLMGVWKALFFDPGEFTTDPTRSAQWNRGAYLVEGLAHCSACHSPRNLLGAEQTRHAMRGGEYMDRVPEFGYRHWSAPNLTASERGLGLWPRDELIAYLGHARNRFVESFGPMNEVIVNSTRHLAPQDLEAMAIYLKSLPAREEGPPSPVEPMQMGRGRTVYNLHCGTCHLPTGEGDPEMAPRLDRGSLVVQAANPASMINTILFSPEPPDLAERAAWREPMQDFQFLLDDEEVAAVATYIRNSWGNRAGAVSADQVAKQRE